MSERESINLSKCTHENVADTTTWGQAAEGTDTGICQDCYTHVQRPYNTDEKWQPRP